MFFRVLRKRKGSFDYNSIEFKKIKIESIEYNDNDITGSSSSNPASNELINPWYPSSNNQQQIKSFERQDSNTSQSNRQYNLPNNNQQIDSQMHYNRRLNKEGPPPVIPTSTIINPADNNKKCYKNTVLKCSQQPATQQLDDFFNILLQNMWSNHLMSSKLVDCLVQVI
jgi:hypothetical protein